MLHISPDLLATLSAPKAKAAALAAHAAAFNDPSTDWRALAEMLAMALQGKPRGVVASEAGDKPPVWWCDGAIKRRGGSYERGRFSVLFADGQTVRCNVHRENGKPWMVAKAVRVAIGFYRGRAGNCVGKYGDPLAVPEMLLVENTTAGTIHDAAICNSLTAEIRAAPAPAHVPSKAERLARAERLAFLARGQVETGKLQQALAYMDARDADAKRAVWERLKLWALPYGRRPEPPLLGGDLRKEGDASLEAWEFAASGLRHEVFRLVAFDEALHRQLRRTMEGEPRSRVYDYREAEIPVPVPTGPRARVYDRPAPRSRVHVEPELAWAYGWFRSGAGHWTLMPRGENPLASKGRLAIAGECKGGFVATCLERKPDGREGVRSTAKRDLCAALAWAVETLRAGGFALEPSPSPGVAEPEPPTPPAPPPAKRKPERKPREPAAILPPPVVAFGEAGPVVALRVGPDGSRARAKMLGVFASFSQAWEATTGRFVLGREPRSRGGDFTEHGFLNARVPDSVRFELRCA